MVITILSVEGGRVRLGFEADTTMPIHRREVWDRIQGEHATDVGRDGTGQSRGRLGALREQQGKLEEAKEAWLLILKSNLAGDVEAKAKLAAYGVAGAGR
jgi:sRNA-binding carbon storage regulator CsrA